MHNSSGWFARAQRVASGVTLGLTLLAAAGCASSREDTERHAEPAILPQTLTLTLPKGALLQRQALVSTEQMSIAPYAKLTPSADGFAEVASLGLTNIGADASVQSIWSQGKLSLAERARVNGFIKTTSPPSKQNGVVITGAVDASASLTPPSELSVSVAFAGGADVALEPNQRRTLPPGAYGRISVKTGATLSLAAGKYSLTALSTETNATLTVDTRSGPVLIYTQSDLTLKGKVSYVGDDSSLLLVHAGSNAVTLESPFTGSVFAPKAALRLAPVAAPGFRGSFFGKSVGVEANASVTLDPFDHWGAVFPPVPFVNCVSQVAPDAYVALFGYRSALDVDVAIPVGSDNSFSPAPTPAASPPTVFRPGENPMAAWVPIGNAPLTWHLRVASATASPSSTPCAAGVYPAASLDGQPRGEHPSPPLALKRKPSSYFNAPATPLPPPAPASKTTAGTPQKRLLRGPPPFVLRITGGTTGQDGAFASRDLDAEVTINGEDAGTKDVYSDGCVFNVDACAYGEPFSANVAFTRPVGTNISSVPVRIRLIERDNFGDNTVLDQTITVNNTTGAIDIPNPLSGSDGWQINVEVEHTGLPVVAAEPKICVSVNADFVDEGFGEDFTGTAVPGQTYKAYPAAFAYFQLFVSGPAAEGNTAGYLDEDGCVPPTFIPPVAYAYLSAADTTDAATGALELHLNVDFRQFRRPDMLSYNVFTLTGVPRLSTYDSVRPGDVPLGGWTKSGAWMVPPSRIDLQGKMLSPFTNLAAAIGGLMSRDDMGIPIGSYQVTYGQGCPFTDQNTGITIVDSCFVPSEDVLYIGPATRPPSSTTCNVDADCPTVQLCFDSAGAGSCDGGAGCFCGWPDQSRWKYVILHEAGHQVQARAMGADGGGDYTFACPKDTTCSGKASGWIKTRLVDPPFVDSMSPLCGCQHVGAANSEHCLQSIERTSAAQGEGFAQFFAAKGWNAPRTDDCKFVYYKELLQDTPCAAGETCLPFTVGQTSLFSKLPPFGISCETAFKWRNNHCPMGETAEMGTELDWLGFLWGVNTQGDSRATMNDLFAIYRNSCNPLPSPGPGMPGEKCEGEEELGWSTRAPVPQDPAVACSAATASNCSADYACLNPATRKRCRDGDTGCSCQRPAVFGISSGAALYFGNDPTRLQNVFDKGLTYGVTSDLAP
jgi:hypothetical protein